MKVWQLGSTTPNFTLEGHEKGVNCIDYYHGGDKPYLISGADDRLVKIWDYQNKTCVQTLEGHAQNIAAVSFHPELPIILTGSEDGTVRVWHANTYRLENTLNYGLERVWSVICMKGNFQYDEKIIYRQIGTWLVLTYIFVKFHEIYVFENLNLKVLMMWLLVTMKDRF